MVRRLSIVVIVCGSLLAALAAQPGLDYFNDSGAIDRLARGDLDSFFAEQPLMGPLSQLLRAPFVALVFHADLDTVYLVGALPCLAALVAVTVVLLRRMRRAGRGRSDVALVALLCLGSIALVRAVHWGHPEDVLAGALAMGAMLAAGDRRPLLAGALVGTAFASKQSAVLAALPALLVLPGGRRACVAAAAGTGAALMLPLLAGDPERFLLVQRAAGSIDPIAVLGNRPPAPGAHVNPFDVWLPFADPAPFDGRRLLFMDDTLARFAHPLILLVGVALPWLVWRRRARRIELLCGFKLLALVLLLRCALDPMSLEYYHLPLVLALAGAAACGGRRELDGALLGVAGLTIAFAHTATSVEELERLAGVKFALYFAAVVPLGVWLARDVLGLARPVAAPRLTAPVARVTRSG